MKPIRLLFILLIGMISLTVYPSTSTLEKKEKKELSVITPNSIDYIVSLEVENKIFIFTHDVKEKVKAIIVGYQKQNESYLNIFSNIPKDVGWMISSKKSNLFSKPINKIIKRRYSNYS